METTRLKATGYDWTCPGCGKNNYEGRKKPEVTCPKCQKMWTVIEVRHKGVADEQIGLIVQEQSGAVLVACSYYFVCPECEKIDFVAEPVKQVKCRHCRSQAEILGISHSREDWKDREGTARMITAPTVKPRCRQLAMF